MIFATLKTPENRHFLASVANSLTCEYPEKSHCPMADSKNGGNALPHLKKRWCGKVWQVWQGHGRNAATPPTPPFRGVGWGKACSA